MSQQNPKYLFFFIPLNISCHDSKKYTFIYFHSYESVRKPQPKSLSEDPS